MPPHTKKKKVSIDLNIRALQINNLTTSVDVLILWKQRTKAIDTKVQRLGPEKPMAIFDEKFQMKTAIDWDNIRGKFAKKQSILAVFTKDRSRLLGEADFDLGKYANDSTAQMDRLTLRNCEPDPEAFIEIYIKAKTLEDTTPQVRRSNTMNQSGRSHYAQSLNLAAIEEKNSEFDQREEFENQEKTYQRQIQRLEDELEGLQKEIRHKQQNITAIQNESTMNMLPAATLLEDRTNEIQALESELKMLEGDYGDEEEDSPLDSSQTLSLSKSMSKQIAAQDNLSMTQNDVTELNMFVKELVANSGFSPAVALNDEQFEQVFASVVLQSQEQETIVQEKERSLKHIYSFDRFN